MDYKFILRRSWEITKTQKLLWVFGMAVAAFTASGPNLNFSGDLPLDRKTLKFPQDAPPVEEIPKQTSQVLGAYTDLLKDMLVAVPPWVWIVLATSIIVAIVAGLGLGFFIRNWAKGALIASLHDIEDQKPIALRSGSQRGLSVVKRFIIIDLVPLAYFLATIFLITIVMAVAALLIQNQWLRLLMLIGTTIIGLVLFLIGGLLVILTTILAEQLVVRENLSTKGALQKGFHLSKKYVAPLLGMGTINLAIGCATVLFILLLGAIVAIAFLINREAGLAATLLIAIPIILIILSTVLIKGIYTVFNTTTWTLIAREIEKKERGEEQHV